MISYSDVISTIHNIHIGLLFCIFYIMKKSVFQKLRGGRTHRPGYFTRTCCPGRRYCKTHEYLVMQAKFKKYVFTQVALLVENKAFKFIKAIKTKKTNQTKKTMIFFIGLNHGLNQPTLVFIVLEYFFVVEIFSCLFSAHCIHVKHIQHM